MRGDNVTGYKIIAGLKEQGLSVELAGSLSVPSPENIVNLVNSLPFNSPSKGPGQWFQILNW